MDAELYWGRALRTHELNLSTTQENKIKTGMEKQYGRRDSAGNWTHMPGKRSTTDIHTQLQVTFTL